MKKAPAEYDRLTEEYFKITKEKGCSPNLCNYVWNVLVATSRGYGFNASHTLAYSLIALQEMNLAYKYPIIFWNTACLITDSGGAEDIESEDKNNNYDKIAQAINKMQMAGVKIALPDINLSQYTFTPNIEENKIYFGLRGMLNVGEDVIQDIISNRPYTSPRDFLNKVKPKKQSMISLIKGGAFDNMLDRKLCMGWYIWENCDKKKRITLQNMPGLIKYDLIPKDTDKQILAKRIYEFNRYLKAICKDTASFYKLDDRAIKFLIEIGQEELITNGFKLDQKIWDKKVYQPWMDVFRDWIAENKEQILNNLNQAIFSEDWDKYAKGNLSSWEMEALCFYYHDHELKNVNMQRYGLSDFYELPEEPEIERSFIARNGGQINIFKLHRICGTCIAKNKAKGLVTLLTSTGVVKIKMRKEYFGLFDKQISERQEDGTKHIVEKSWFNRGNMILVQGFRSGDTFILKKYASSGNVHQLYKINEILLNGELILQNTRHQGDLEDET